jgi:anti-sigma regulatory factor (Ser/Thr protein kinase)
MILCPYDAGRLEPGILGYALRTHPIIDDDNGRRASTAYTAPELVVANLNQPLPAPRGPVTELVFDSTGLRAVRALASEHAERAGLTPDRVGDLRLAVNEIATNTIVHGSGPGTFLVWREADRVLCEIRGPGEITDWLAGRVWPANSSPRGRGLLVANRVCDLVQIYTGPNGTTTRLHMRT